MDSMMSHNLPYAHEKLTGAVETLATSTAPIQQRVADGLLTLITRLSEADFPEGEICDAWRRVKRQADAIADAGNLYDNCLQRSDIECREAARSIWALHQLVAHSGSGFWVAPQAA
jgi:hypothetical protein